jgi:glycerol-3-phosphate dehydrogenase (NAD(P)+)
LRNKKSNIAVIGDGSWATALIKLFTNHQVEINWYIRQDEILDKIKENGRNPLYLSSVKLDMSKINLSNDINEIICQSDSIVFVVPSAFFHSTYKKIVRENLNDKILISAIKGIVHEKSKIVSDFLITEGFSSDKIVAIAGPCHAEEVAMEKLSYLTIASENEVLAKDVAGILSCNYIKSSSSADIVGVEYSAVMKNIMAIAAGICHSLGFGDNFQSVLLSNALNEINIFLDAVYPLNRNINKSAYLGDLAVTAYSQFSRNRTFGAMIGKGYSVKSAQLEMNMVAEGYFGTNSIMKIVKNLNIELPIIQAVYNILYLNISPYIEINLLTDKLK